MTRASHPVRRLSTRLLLPAVLTGWTMFPAGLAAQQDTTGTRDGYRRGVDSVRIERQEPGRSGSRPPDFLFAEPRVSLGLRGGMTFPRAGSDVFTGIEQDLTLNRSSFRALTGAVDLGVRITPRLDAVFSAAYGRSSKLSEFRDFLDDNNLPIQQRTKLAQIPLTAGLKAYLLPRGYQIGHFVWVPRRVAPYVGAAGGFVHHRFEQSGDFVDHRDLAIYNAVSVSEGWSPTAQVFGGVDVGITRHTSLKLEGRWAWASADPGVDYQSYSSLDLAGLQTTVGLSWRY